MMARVAIIAFCLVGRGAGHQLRRDSIGDELSVLLNGEPNSGMVLMENIVIETMRAHCNKTQDCQTSVKSRNDADDYKVVVSAWPGARRVASTALKHIIPNVGHLNGVDFASMPDVSQLDVERAVGKTLTEMPSGGRYLVLLRDPRDVIMSTCFGRQGGCPDPDQYAREHMPAAAAWLSTRYKFFQMLLEKMPESVLMLFYEDVIVDLATAVQDISDFIGTPLGDEFTEYVGQAVKDLQTDAGSTRIAPHACGFTRELTPWVVRNVTAVMNTALPAELSSQWACGR